MPNYLTGELAVDYGWDTAGLGVDSAKLALCKEVEVILACGAILGMLEWVKPPDLTGILVSDRVVIGKRARVYLHGR